MARKVYEEENIRAIADKIRSKTGGDSTYKTSEMADGVEEVYEAGGKAEYDRFWDNYQDYGNRTNQRFLFAGHGWTKETMKPKYDIDIDDGYMMFAYNQVQDDLVELLKDTKIIYNYVSSLQYMFFNACFTRVGEVDASSNGLYQKQLYGTFSTAKYLKTIDKLILRDDGQNSFHSTFDNCTSLENITIEGVIGNDFKISFSPLTHDSLMSIINALKDFSAIVLESVEYTANNGTDPCEIGVKYYGSLVVTQPNEDGTFNMEFQSYTGNYETGEDFHMHVLYLYNMDKSYVQDEEGLDIYYNAFQINEDGTVSLWQDNYSIETTKTLTLGATNLAKLTDSEKAMATEKGWTLI